MRDVGVLEERCVCSCGEMSVDEMQCAGILSATHTCHVDSDAAYSGIALMGSGGHHPVALQYLHEAWMKTFG
jgi:hypothetical protein